MEPLTILLGAAAALLVLGGLAGAFVPVLPGPPLVFLGLWLAAWLGGFERVSGYTVAFLAFLAALAVLLDVVAGALGAKRVGASRLAALGAVMGAVVGLFFGLPGLLLGPFAGAVIGELLARGGMLKAANVGMATWAGLVFGAFAKLFLSLLMVGVFAVAWVL
jgi:uncharacterized protein